MNDFSKIHRVEESYPQIKNQNLSGRYITFSDIEPEMEKFKKRYSFETIGTSVRGVKIPSITFGSGKIKILAWSQMHGNETTTTKAVFDLLNLFADPSRWGVSEILSKCTLKFIPMLNPDGAAEFKRENGNSVDLNRDAQELSQPESSALRACLDAFQPDFCFNLHDQRTLFSAGETSNPATLSFLAPAVDDEKTITKSRARCMQAIAVIKRELQNYLAEQIGRYDDAFNINCTGDTFQSLEIPTLLFEAGFYQHDYLREESRKFVFLAILFALENISSGAYKKCKPGAYFEIPENQKKFFDVILINAQTDAGIKDIAIQYEEKLESGKVEFLPVVKKIADKLDFFAHREINCHREEILNKAGTQIRENDLVNHILLKGKEFTIKVE